MHIQNVDNRQHYYCSQNAYIIAAWEAAYPPQVGTAVDLQQGKGQSWTRIERGVGAAPQGLAWAWEVSGASNPQPSWSDPCTSFQTLLRLHTVLLLLDSTFVPSS